MVVVEHELLHWHLSALRISKGSPFAERWTRYDRCLSMRNKEVEEAAEADVQSSVQSLQRDSHKLIDERMKAHSPMDVDDDECCPILGLLSFEGGGGGGSRGGILGACTCVGADI